MRCDTETHSEGGGGVKSLLPLLQDGRPVNKEGMSGNRIVVKVEVEGCLLVCVFVSMCVGVCVCVVSPSGAEQLNITV